LSAFSLFGKGSETPTLQLYGKLPIAKDYLRIGCGDGAALAMRDLLDGTFGTTRKGEDEFVLHETLRFIIGGKEPLQGTIWASSDAGGHRRFPFMLCVDRRAKKFAHDFEHGLVQAEGVWRSLAEIFGDNQDCGDGQELLQRQRGRTLELEPEGVSGVAGTDFAAWVSALWPSEGMAGLHSLLSRLREQSGTKSSLFRLPLVRELPLRDQVVGWTSMLESLGLIPGGVLPTIFFPTSALLPSSEVASLVVTTGMPSAETVRWLTAEYGPERLGEGDYCAGLESPESEVVSSADEPPPLRVSLAEVLRGGRG